MLIVGLVIYNLYKLLIQNINKLVRFQKRIKFYERYDFKLNTYEYLQPPLRKGCTYYPLKLMSYKQTLSFDDFKKIKNTLYQEVYKIPL